MAKDILPGGLADNKPDSDFDPKALKEGIKVEKEHTSNPQIAKEVAKDHLQEFPKYYPALKVMENKLKREFKKSSLLKSEAPFKIGDRVSKKGEKVVSGTVTAIKPHRSGHKIKFKSDTHKPGELFHGGKGDLWVHASYFEKELKKSSLLAKAPLIGDYSQGVEDQSYKNKKNIKQLSHKAISNKHGKEIIHSVGNEDFLKGQGGNPFGWHYITANNKADGDVISFIKVTGADNSSPNGPYIAISFTDKNSRGMGLSSALHQYAANHHGVIYSDSSISPQEHSVWQRGQKTNKVSLSPTYPTRDMFHMEPLSTDTDDYDLAVSSQHSWKKNESKEKFKFKKSSLIKGAARRLYGRFDPNKLPGRDQVGEWQTSVGFIQDMDSGYDEDIHREARESIPKMDPAQRLRALNKLSAQTLTRKHPETGERQFLLFRGIGPDEMHTVGEHHIENDQKSSWTPKKGMADVFASEKQDGEGRTVGAWINESDIHAAPHMYGKLPDLEQDFDNAGQLYVPDSPVKGKNVYSNEHEIIVGPHKSMRATKGDAKKHFAVNEFQTPQHIASTKDVNAKIQGRAERAKMGIKPSLDLQLQAEKRRKFKKSSLLQKGARGNWKKEGYKLKMNSDVNYYGTPVMHIQAVHPKHGIVGESFIENRGDHLFPHETEVHEDHRRKGLASAMYDLAERHTGSQLQPSIHDQSDDAKALWENRLNKTLAKPSIFSK